VGAGSHENKEVLWRLWGQASPTQKSILSQLERPEDPFFGGREEKKGGHPESSRLITCTEGKARVIGKGGYRHFCDVERVNLRERARVYHKKRKSVAGRSIQGVGKMGRRFTKGTMVKVWNGPKTVNPMGVSAIVMGGILHTQKGGKKDGRTRTLHV